MEKIAQPAAASARILGPGASARVGEALAQFMPGKHYLLVCDDATWVACGQQIYLDLLAAHVSVTPFSLGRTPAASMVNCERVVPALAGMDGAIAVGSGTINDITKYAAMLANLPYLVVATAASMNGYTSATASLEQNQFKHSYPCRPPVAVVADLSVITAAPRRLSRAGLGDMLCRSSVECDTILANFLFDAPYPDEAFALFRRHEATLISEAPRFKQGDTAYFALLMEALLDSGDWMAKTGSSAIASQGEHMIVHTAELMYGAELRQYTHGELVALATITCGNLQEKMLLAQPVIRSLVRGESDFIRQFGRRAGPDIYALYCKKVLSPEAAEAATIRLQAGWAEIKQRIQAVMQPVGVLERLYRQVNLPTTPNDLSLNVDRYSSAVTYAFLTRDRFTFLDLAAMNVRR